MANFIAATFVALLKWWLENKRMYSPEQMDEMFEKLTFDGIESRVMKK